MNVKLINVADYDIKDGKISQIPFETFKNLSGYQSVENNESSLRTARLFKSVEEFKKLSTSEIEEFDVNENVNILNNGQFIVLFKPKSTNIKTIPKENKAYVSTNTETNKEK